MPSEKKHKKVKVYFITPAPAGISPGQRFRFEHYLPFLKESGTDYHLSPFYSLNGWERLYKKGFFFRKALSVLAGFMKRFVDLFRIPGYQYVYLYREAAPVGPPFFEWMITKLLRKKLIYDFDDAIWIPVTSEQNRIAGYIKCFYKIGSICKMAHIVTTGNSFLGSFAGKYNSNTTVIPTVVDTEKAHNKLRDQDADQPAIGWTGTFSTLKYLDICVPALQELQARIDFTFIVIADKDPGLPLKNYRFIKWNKETEIEDLLKMHIGIMPLYNSELEMGKCGFKAIQYMALGIPAVVSPVGVNPEIVEDGVNGFVASNESEWISALEKLLTNPELRRRMGERSRLKIEQAYSVNATKNQFINLFP